MVATEGVPETQGVLKAAVADPANWVVAPMHTAKLPVIVGAALTVMVAVFVHPPMFL